MQKAMKVHVVASCEVGQVVGLTRFKIKLEVPAGHDRGTKPSHVRGVFGSSPTGMVMARCAGESGSGSGWE